MDFICVVLVHDKKKRTSRTSLPILLTSSIQVKSNDRVASWYSSWRREYSRESLSRSVEVTILTINARNVRGIDRIPPQREFILRFLRIIFSTQFCKKCTRLNSVNISACKAVFPRAVNSCQPTKLQLTDSRSGSSRRRRKVELFPSAHFYLSAVESC